MKAERELKIKRITEGDPADPEDPANIQKKSRHLGRDGGRKQTGNVLAMRGDRSDRQFPQTGTRLRWALLADRAHSIRLPS